MKNRTKAYLQITAYCAAFLLGFVAIFGGLTMLTRNDTCCDTPVPSVLASYISDTSDDQVPIVPDCGCECSTNPSNNNVWLLALLAMILVAILVVLIFRRPGPQQGKAKRGKGDGDLDNRLHSQHDQGYAASALYHGQSQTQPQAGLPSSSQPRESNIADQLLEQARAKVAAAPQTAGQRTGTPSASTAQPSSTSSSSSLQNRTVQSAGQPAQRPSVPPTPGQNQPSGN